MLLPVVYQGTSKLVLFYIIPAFTQKFILGINFWKQFKIAPELFTSINSDTLSNTVVYNEIGDVRSITPASKLSSKENSRLNHIIDKFRSISFEEKGLGLTHLVQHKIETTCNPIKQRYYPLSPARQRQLEAELDEMLKLGVVRPSRSPWSNPVVIVTKKDGSGRLCLDSRALNKNTLPFAYPLPYISRILDKLRVARFISSIDLSRAFWQIPLDKDSCEKTAFVVPGRGLFEFVRMPFGIKNAASEMQRLADILFGPEFDENVFCYLDDLILISEDLNSHFNLLEKVFLRLKEAGLTVNLKKCEFCKHELKYLGYIVDSKGLRTDPSKIECIKNYPVPKNSKQLKSFLGLSGYYRRFIKDFSTITAPLTKLTGSKNGISKFIWSPEAENAFNLLKNALISAPVLSCPDFKLPFAIHCDASGVAIGSVLTQTFGEEEHPIAYFSRSLNVHERNYGITERELLAVLDSVTHFRSYIEGSHFKIVTDHSSLQWLTTLSNPSGRLARWSTRLSQYSFDVVHKKGSLNTVPDVLSRVEVALVNDTLVPISKDKWYIDLWSGCKKFPQRYLNFQIRDNELYRHSKTRYSLCEDTAWKLVVPEEKRKEILVNQHESDLACHPGVFRTYKKVQLRYYWPNLYQNVKSFVNNCSVCKAHKISTSPPLGLSTNHKVVTKPMQMLSVDLVGPLPRSYSGHNYILSCVDVFSKYCWLFPLRNGTAPSIVKNIEENIFLVHGVPHSLVCDNGKVFVSKNFKNLLAEYNVPAPFYNTLYTPQNNVVERYNQTIGTALSILVENDHRKWAKVLPRVQTALNNCVNFSTNFTPYFLMHGREQILDGNLHKLIESSNTAAQDTRQTYGKKLEELIPIYEQVTDSLFKAYKKGANHYNLRRKSVVYAEGDIVWRRNFVQSSAINYFAQKLAPRFVCKVVVKKISDLVYKLADLNGKIVGDFHVKDIVKSN